MGASKVGQEGIACIRADAHLSSYSQENDVCARADADAQLHARSVSSSYVSLNDWAEMDREPDTEMSCLSLLDNVQAVESSAQESRLGHSPDRPHGSSAVLEEAAFSVSTANSTCTVNAIEALTVSPGRRVFAAQVTLTRPTTPANPASAYH